jgi:nucleotide-binding universal stress UspA family protein
MSEPAPESHLHRIFLVVVDKSPEMPVALYYASRRARRTGGHVALLHVSPPPETHGLRAVEDLMRDEQRQEAELLVLRLAKEVQDHTGTMPVLYMREGKSRDELLALIDEEPTISVLVLAAATGPEGPGPLISYLSRAAGKLRIPVTLVPGSLTREQLDAIT